MSFSGRVKSSKRLSPGDVVDFFNSIKPTKKPKLKSIFEPEDWTLTNTPTGLGDTVMMTDIERAAFEGGRVATSWLPTPLFREIQNHNPYHVRKQSHCLLSLSAVQERFDLGPGHNFQRARRLFGLPVSCIPRGSIVQSKPVPVPVAKKVTIHIEPGPHAEFQKRYHKRPRVVYEQNIEVLKKFIRSQTGVDFVEIGTSTLSDCARRFSGSVSELIAEMSTASMHIGIISGPYHLATALGIPTVCIINFPSPWELMLPVVRNVDVVEAEWLYPQSQILHQDHDSAHWPIFNLLNLEKAYNFELFPYYGDKQNPREFAELIQS